MGRRKRQQAPAHLAGGARQLSDRRRAVAFVIVLVAVTGGLAFWMRPAGVLPVAPSAKPNVIVITLDTTRADRIGSYGYAPAATPQLDRLAARGVRFDQALSSAPLTLPAHASLMTGRQPYVHGVRNNGYFVLSADVPTLAEAFAANGYDTAAFVSAFVLDRQFGLAQGFSHYDSTLDRGARTESSLDLERRGDRTVRAAIEWSATRRSERPFFLWVHLFDPHEPYAPPSPFREQFAGNPYDGEIAFSDALVGNLLERTGAAPSTLVVVAGDHGESLGDHGESTHGLFVYESVLRVPLIIAGAGITASRVVTEPVRLIDVAPTIADLAGIDPIPGAEGRSLRSLMNGGDRGEDPPPVYAETYFPQFYMGWAPLRSLRVGRWKFIDAPEPELYDLSADGAERTNVIGREPSRAQSLRRALTSILSAHANRTSPTPMSDDARRRLASLGYVSGVTPPAGSEAQGADPKQVVAVFERLLDGNRALARGDAAKAASVAGEITRLDRRNAFAWLLQGRAALALDRHHDAMKAFEQYLTLVPQSADAHHLMALAAVRLGDRERALAEEEAAIALDPRHTSAIALRAGLLFSAGRVDQGIASLREAVQQEPANYTLVLELADLLADAGRFRDAESEYRRVLVAEPSNGRALAGLGMLLAATDRLEASLDPLTRALELDASDDEARLARADVLSRLGRGAEAREDFEHLARAAVRPDIKEIARRALRNARPGRP